MGECQEQKYGMTLFLSDVIRSQKEHLINFSRGLHRGKIPAEVRDIYCTDFFLFFNKCIKETMLDLAFLICNPWVGLIITMSALNCVLLSIFLGRRL